MGVGYWYAGELVALAPDQAVGKCEDRTCCDVLNPARGMQAVRNGCGIGVGSSGCVRHVGHHGRRVKGGVPGRGRGRVGAR